MFSSAILLDPHLRVLAAGPMNHQDDFLVFLIHIGNYFRDQDADDALSQTHVCGRRIPNSGKIVRQVMQSLSVRNSRHLGRQLLFAQA
jgi:hypothetical protein